MTVQLHGRIRFRPWGLFLSETDEDAPDPIRDQQVEISFRPGRDRYDPEVVISSVFVPPSTEIADALAQWWPTLLEEAQSAADRREHAYLSTDIGPAEGALFWMPERAVASFFDEARRTLRAQYRRVAGLLRWHLNIHTFAPAHGGIALEWSQDGLEWVEDLETRDLPQELGSVGAELGGGQDLVAFALEANPEGQPLAHELLQESLSLATESPRSALVLAMTAAEVGVRSLAAAVGREDAAWLLSRPKSPPLDDLLKNYLPFVTDKRTRAGSVVPVELRKQLRRAVEARNKVVHFGEPGLSEDDLFDALTAVSDLLYILDWFAGRRWALANVSRQWSDEYA